MITPFDIEKKVFGKSVRGYNIEEVDLFLDEIIVDYEKILDSNEKLKEEIQVLNKDMENYKKSENSVLNTLESAKHLMSDISASAEKRAETILKNARLDAEVIQREAKESIGSLNEEAEALRNKIARYRERYKQILRDELSQLDNSSAELIAEMERDFVPASMISNSDVESTYVTNNVAADKPISKAVKIDESQEAPSEKPREEMSAIEMIMEDFKNSPVDPNSKTRIINPKEDLTKTRIL